MPATVGLFVAIAVLSVLTRHPLVVDYSGNHPVLTASHSLTTVFTTEHLEPVQTSGNGQGIHFLTTFDKIYYLALALNNNTIVVAHRDELNENYIRNFRKEDYTSSVVCYYVETGGSRYYLKALPNGDITTLAVSGSTTDSGTLFRDIIG